MDLLAFTNNWPRQADRFIADPAEVLHLDQEVLVRVTEVDIERKRIQLSLRKVS